MGTFLWGALAFKYGWPPKGKINEAADMISEVVSPSDNLLAATPARNKVPIQTYLPAQVQPGLLLVALGAGNRDTRVQVITREGKVLNEWYVRWSDIWRNDEGRWPKIRRTNTGMFLHGLEILPDASIVTNFEYLSTIRLDACNKLVWKLDNMGHHAVHRAADGTLWVTALDFLDKNPTGYPLHLAPFESYLLQQISEDGKIMRSIPIVDVLRKNDLNGLLYLSSVDTYTPAVIGDTMHLNDIETFPENWPSEMFAPGDILMSLRNINTVMVIDPKTLKVKWRTTGEMLRQHDADFMPGDHISVFDNNNFDSAPEAGPPASRIVEFDARTNTKKTVISGAGVEPFFTRTKGVHQRLSNGNILVAVSESDS